MFFYTNCYFNIRQKSEANYLNTKKPMEVKCSSTIKDLSNVHKATQAHSESIKRQDIPIRTIFEGSDLQVAYYSHSEPINIPENSAKLEQRSLQGNQGQSSPQNQQELEKCIIKTLESLKEQLDTKDLIIERLERQLKLEQDNKAFWMQALKTKINKLETDCSQLFDQTKQKQKEIGEAKNQLLLLEAQLNRYKMRCIYLQEQLSKQCLLKIDQAQKIKRYDMTIKKLEKQLNDSFQQKLKIINDNNDTIKKRQVYCDETLEKFGRQQALEQIYISKIKKLEVQRKTFEGRAAQLSKIQSKMVILGSYCDFLYVKLHMKQQAQFFLNLTISNLQEKVKLAKQDKQDAISKLKAEFHKLKMMYNHETAQNARLNKLTYKYIDAIKVLIIEK